MILVIAVSYFGSEDLAPYLKSLQEQRYEAWRLVIVDNSEDDDEWKRVDRCVDGEPRAIALRAPRNLGYFGAVDWVLPQVPHHKTSWVIVSNTDVCLANNETFAELVRMPMNGVGVVAPSIRSAWDGRDQNPYQLHRPTVAQMRRRKLMLGNPVLAQLVILMSAMKRRIFRTRRVPAVVLNTQSIYAAHGSFFAVSRTFLDCGGSFNFPLFLFAEEQFLAEQSRKLGLQTLYAPRVKVNHIEHGQTGYFRSLAMLRHQGRAARYGYALIKGESDVGPT